MLIEIFKFYVIYFFTIFICFKLIKTQVKHFATKIFFLILPLVLAILTYYLDATFVRLKYICPLIVLSVIIGIFTSKPKISFAATTISWGISYSLHAITSFFIITITYILYNNFEKLPYSLLSITSTLLQTVLTLALLKFPRFKSGITRIISINYINITTLVCFVFISLSEYVYTNKSFALGIFSFIFLYAFLIFWWQAQITKSYRHRLLMRELESLRTSEAEKDALIEKLYAEIDRLARISHRDNSLIMAVKDAAVKGLRTDFESAEELVATREKLIANIEKLAEGRSSIPSDYSEKKVREFETGLGLLDDLLQLMDKKAIEQGITFSVHFGVSIKDFVPSDISESDLAHTVDDLLKNAFKATHTCEKRIVQLQFYKLGKHLVIEVSDNGIPFEICSLANMGLEKLTTYEDGSGIGLVDIWNTKEKYGATYHLEEFVTPSPFSKKISLTFDKKNRYSIRTFRKNEILQMSRRADLQVYDHVE